MRFSVIVVQGGIDILNVNAMVTPSTFVWWKLLAA
jgi:hypothetical protein